MARRLAFLIGNQNFRPDADLDPLKGPLNDIAELGKVLADPERGQFEVHSFADRGRAEIMPALEEALNGAELGDMVLLFYAGHGKLDPSGRLCLATAETRAAALYSTSIPSAELRSLIGHSRCESIVLLLDCCYSGAAGKEFVRGGAADQLSLMREAQGLHVLTSATGYQTAKELESAEGGRIMGHFTRAVVSGLASGEADSDKDGKVSLADLRKYLSRVIRGQTPQYFAQNASDDPVLGLARPPEPPEQKRLRRLGAWYAEGKVPHDRYQALVDAASGQGESRLSVMVQGLLDDAATTPQSLLAAWDGATKPPRPPPPIIERASLDDVIKYDPNTRQIMDAVPNVPPPPLPGPPKSDSVQIETWLMGGGVAAAILGVLGGSEGVAWLGILALLAGAAMFALRIARRFF
jgi:uncharacterized caspase-like protein